MTQPDLIKLLTARFYENFADEVSARVRDADAVGELYALVTADDLPRNVRHPVAFRGAYVLERLFFDAPELFEPCVESFLNRDFAVCTDPSSRRHFGKIMAHLLRDRMPEPDALARIADAAADWAVDPRSKVAVRIWAVEVLKCCRDRVAWVEESWGDIVEAQNNDATPGISNRMRKSWK